METNDFNSSYGAAQPLRGQDRPSFGNVRTDAYDLGDAWLEVRRSLPLILKVACVVVFLIVAVTLVTRMKFHIHGSLFLGEIQSKPAAANNLSDQLDFVGNRSSDVNTELEILQSRDLVAAAALRSGMNAEISPKEWKRPRLWKWLLSGRRIGLVDPPNTVVVTNAVLPENSVRDEEFDVAFTGGEAFDILSAGSLVAHGKFGTPVATDRLKITLDHGRDGNPNPGDIYHLRVAPVDDTLDRLSKSLVFAAPKGSGSPVGQENARIANIDLLGVSPRQAVRFVSEIMDGYLRERQQWRTQEATAAESFIEKQANSIHEALDDADQKLAEYKKNSKLVVLGDDTSAMIEQTGQFEQQRLAAEMQLESFNQISSALRRPNAPIEQFLVGDTADPVLANLAASLSQAQRELQAARERFTDDAPAVREAAAQVDAQIHMTQNYIVGRRQRAQQQLSALNRIIDRFDNKLKGVPRAELDLARLTRNADVLNKMYTFLLERQQEAAVAKASTISRNHVLDRPVAPHKADSPSLPLRIVLAAVLGLFLGIVTVLIRRALSQTIQTERDLRTRLGPIPIVGLVPEKLALRLPGRTVASATPFDFDLFGRATDGAFGEAFRHLRATLYYQAKNKDLKVFLITSPSPGDGKTACSLALAAAFAADAKRVLVIEGDMHRPTHHTIFRQSPEPGLTSLVTQHDIVRTIKTETGEFDAITAGVAADNPAEFFSSQAFSDLVTFARTNYDFVIIDSPPFPLVSDALVIATHVDCILTVVRLGRTSRRVLEEHTRRLAASAPTRMRAVIVNDVDRASSLEYGYGQSYAIAPAGKLDAGPVRRS